MKRKWIGYWMVLLLSIIALSLYGCGDDGGGGGGGGGEAEQAEEPGNATMTLAGAEGTTTGGGMGGTALLGAFGNINISRFGDVDASFSIPEYTPIDLGSNPLVVSADLTIPVYPNSFTQAHSGYFLMTNDCRIWQGDGVNPPSIYVTGLQVDKGVTLTLGLNKSTGGNDGEDQARICFENDVHILGIIKTQDLTFGNVPYEFAGASPTPDTRHYDKEASPKDMGSLEIEAYRIVMEDSGKIDTSGADGTAAGPSQPNLLRGGDGGGVELENNEGVTMSAGGGIFLKGGSIDATGGNGAALSDGGDGAVVSGEWWEITLSAYGVIINKAALDASGGNSGLGAGVGGNAGDVELWATSSIYNTGALSANGGTSSGAPVPELAPQADGKDGVPWGNAGDIELMSQYASIFNSAALTANGGSGPIGAYGGWIWILAAGTADGYASAGQVKNSGPLTANGGDSSGAGLDKAQPITGADGGEGGAIFLETYGGTIKNSGAVTANGGTGWGYFIDDAQPEDVPCGGDGGCVHFFDDLGLFPPWDNYNTAKAPGPIEVTGNISLNGGTGPAGGSGGALIALNGLCPLNLLDPRSVGTISLKGYGGGPINLNGGPGVSNVPAYMGGEPWYGVGGELVASCGLDVYGMLNFDVAAPDNGSSSGLNLGFGSVTNGVPIQAMGGEGEEVGGMGGYVAMGCEPYWEEFPPEVIETLAVKNSASIDVSGGAGGYEGGWGGGIGIYGHDLTDNSGALTANGGDMTSTAPVSAANPGRYSGGWAAFYQIHLGSTYDVKNSGKITANGGNVLGDYGDGGCGASWVTMWAGNQVANSGSIFANGGNGGSVEGYGGSGGLIDLYSDIVATSNTADTLQVKEGVPDGPGENGHILLDGTDVTPPGGTLP